MSKKPTPQDVELFRAAAERGDAAGQNALGCCTLYGYGGIPKNETEAVKLFQMAASQNFAAAWYNMGRAYHVGWGGLARDVPEAIACLEKAAAEGICAACNQLSNIGCHMLFGDDGFEKNPTEAVRLFRLGAAQDCAVAWCSLGASYLGGLGVEQSTPEAVECFKIAAELGDVTAVRALRDLTYQPYDVIHASEPDDIWAQLTPT
jgi:TPR repeat protein